MRQVLWPKYLLGGLLQRGGGIGGAERGEGDSLAGGMNVAGVRDLIGRWPDAETVLQGGMSEGLRDWDLWYELAVVMRWQTRCADTLSTGALCCSVSYSASSSRSTRKTTSAAWCSLVCSPWSGSERRW